ncbi:MAG: hypothetical protein Q4Q03_08395, partial [Bowdeniella nasicola]|nr:hypothetical protein [Bowdeniella nasicola]
PKPNRFALIVGICVIIAIVGGGGIWWWWQNMRSSYAYGVTTIDTYSNESGVVFAQVTEGDTAVILLATDPDGGLSRWEITDPDHHTNTPVADPPPLAQLLTEKGGVCEIAGFQCPPPEAKISVDGLGEMTWQNDSAQWVSESGVAFDTTLIFGRMDDLLIGNRTEAHLAGSVDTSQIPVDSITAFDIETGDIVWTKYFDHPSIVALGTKHIWAAESPLSWNELQGSDDAEATFAALVDTAERAPTVLRLGPASKANTETFADAPEKATLAAASAATSASTASPTPTPKPTPSETKPAVAPDAIKASDIRNGSVPRASAYRQEHGSRADDFCQDEVYGPNPPNIHKLPDDPDPCLWLDMVDGDSTAQLSYIDAPEGCIGENEYADINGDGYLDALIVGSFWDAGRLFAVIVDPENPSHPYMAYLYGSQYQDGKLNDQGILEMHLGNG